MAGSDVLVNLRHPTMGETSGSVIRGLSLGKPLVVSDVGWFSELPSDVALAIPPDDDEVATLTAALELLASRPEVREAMGENAAELARREHGVERVAELLRRGPRARRGWSYGRRRGASRREPGSVGSRNLGGDGRGEGDRPPPRRGRAWVERFAGSRAGRGWRRSSPSRRSSAPCSRATWSRPSSSWTRSSGPRSRAASPTRASR